MQHSDPASELLYAAVTAGEVLGALAEYAVARRVRDSWDLGDLVMVDRA